MNAYERDLVDCLVSSHNFETYWAYYWTSEAHACASECRQAAKSLAQHLRALAQQDAEVLDPHTDNLLDKLEAWVESPERWPYGKMRDSVALIWHGLGGLQDYLYGKLGIRRPCSRVLTLDQVEHCERAVRWRQHLPSGRRLHIEEDWLEQASRHPTIVVVGDIRRSQDLMTYAKNPESFAARMAEFLSQTRDVADRNHAMFDKFTGDGFLVYFNDHVCARSGRNARQCFVDFVRQEARFAAGLFREWCTELRKLPSEPVGLGMGADIGQVVYDDIDYQLFAVGEAVVWASRMASGAAAEETVLNNLLHRELQGLPGLAFEPVEGTTKTGEGYSAWRLVAEP
ncbi:MAG TPA: adenylate/guanylate cyclase domain-containing protein [Phycisphaerae bacterium]|nr:adenylate/guanylate cyclase domain-containing protein [Phycisphaerae bacterium]